MFTELRNLLIFKFSSNRKSGIRNDLWEWCTLALGKLLLILDDSYSSVTYSSSSSDIFFGFVGDTAEEPEIYKTDIKKKKKVLPSLVQPLSKAISQ